VETTRWIRGMLPLAAVALLAAGVGARPALLQAAGGALRSAWEPPPCAPVSPPPDGAGDAWYRMERVLDAGGTLVGSRLHAGLIGEAGRAIELPAEAFASGPVDGELILVGEDDGTRSRLSLLDPGRGCERPVAEADAVIRSAIAAPDGSWIAEHRVDRGTRADLGVWRRPLDGGPARRLIDGVVADPLYGPTFATELRWAPDDGLVVTSCGELACRTRLVDPGSGGSTTLGPTGPVIGAPDDGGIVAYAVCPGFPCAALRFGAHGDERMVAPAVGRAAVAGRTLAFETVNGGLAVLDLRSGRTTDVAGGAGLVPVGDGSRADSAAGHRTGAVVVAPAGRLHGTDGWSISASDPDLEPLPAVRP
jgi:hypothetical protein